MKSPVVVVRIYRRWYAYGICGTLGAAQRLSADLRSRSFVAAVAFLTPEQYAARRAAEGGR